MGLNGCTLNVAFVFFINHSLWQTFSILLLLFSALLKKKYLLYFLQGVTIKYNEPPEARKPKTKWRLYPFKGEKALRKTQAQNFNNYIKLLN